MINNNLHALRKEKGVAPDTVARIVGIGRSSLFRYENGEEPPVGIALRLAAFYGKMVEEVFTEKKA